jgi:hypothetical protein
MAKKMAERKFIGTASLLLAGGKNNVAGWQNKSTRNGNNIKCSTNPTDD